MSKFPLKCKKKKTKTNYYREAKLNGANSSNKKTIFNIYVVYKIIKGKPLCFLTHNESIFEFQGHKKIHEAISQKQNHKEKVSHKSKRCFAL